MHCLLLKGIFHRQPLVWGPVEGGQINSPYNCIKRFSSQPTTNSLQFTSVHLVHLEGIDTVAHKQNMENNKAPNWTLALFFAPLGFAALAVILDAVLHKTSNLWKELSECAFGEGRQRC